MNEKSASKQFAPAERVHARRFGDDLVLLDLGSGRYYGLNEVGARVWEALVAGETPLDIARQLEAEYAVTGAALDADVEQLTRALVESGLIVEVNS